MSGLINSLNIGRTSLTTAQKAIEIAGNNISNVNTPGYSRQVPILSSYPTLNLNGFTVGQGVKIDHIDRNYDVYLTKQINSKSSTLGEESAKSTPLADLERIISVNEDSLAGQIDDFFASWQTLSTDPGSGLARDNVIRSGETLSKSFFAATRDLQSVRDGINVILQSQVDDINVKLQKVASLNLSIANIEMAGQNALSDRDQRDLLLQELSQSLGATYIENEGGMVSVSLPNGFPVVQDQIAMTLNAVTVNGDTQMQLKVGSASFDLGISSLGGEFKGYLEIRDRFVPGLIADLDRLAHSIVTEVNTQHLQGAGLNGEQGNFFEPPAAVAGASLLMKVLVTDAGQVAAGTPVNPGDPSAPGDNTNALALAGLGRKQVIGNDTFVSFYSGIASKVGSTASLNRAALGGAEDTMVQLRNLRDAKVGVSIEEEMVSLLQYQKNFEASAKLLATVDDMMDSLIALKR